MASLSEISTERTLWQPIGQQSVSRVDVRNGSCVTSTVRTTVRNCTRDEGRTFEAGSQVQASNRCKLLSSKAIVVSVAVNVGTISRRVRLREASASEPSMKCRKRIRRCRNRGVTLPPGSARGNPEACPSGIRHVGEAQPGSCTERENLRGGLLRSSKEAGVMPVERRGQVTDVGSEPTGNRRSSNSRRKAAAFVRWHEPDDARVSSPDL